MFVSNVLRVQACILLNFLSFGLLLYTGIPGTFGVDFWVRLLGLVLVLGYLYDSILCQYLIAVSYAVNLHFHPSLIMRYVVVRILSKLCVEVSDENEASANRHNNN